MYFIKNNQVWKPIVVFAKNLTSKVNSLICAECGGKDWSAGIWNNFFLVSNNFFKLVWPENPNKTWEILTLTYKPYHNLTKFNPELFTTVVLSYRKDNKIRQSQRSFMNTLHISIWFHFALSRYRNHTNCKTYYKGLRIRVLEWLTKIPRWRIKR